MKDKVDAAGRQAMRLIIHLGPLNAILRKPDLGDTRSLPYVGDLVLMALEDEEVLYHFGEDLSVCVSTFSEFRARGSLDSA